MPQNMSQADLDALGYPVFGTQGGGLVRWDALNKAYEFVEEPAWSAKLPDGNPDKLPVGSVMPDEWGLGGQANKPTVTKCTDRPVQQFIGAVVSRLAGDGW